MHASHACILTCGVGAGKEGDGIHEDILDTLHMIYSSGHLAVVLAVQMFGLLAYNFMGMHVTGNLGAVFRTVLETMRTLFVWLIGLVLFYVGSGVGERWTAYSTIQAAGFAVLVLGTVVYGRGDERAATTVCLPPRPLSTVPSLPGTTCYLTLHLCPTEGVCRPCILGSYGRVRDAGSTFDGLHFAHKGVHLLDAALVCVLCCVLRCRAQPPGQGLELHSKRFGTSQRGVGRMHSMHVSGGTR